MSRLTFFTTCKPFTGRFTTIQYNALRSWQKLCPPNEVLVFGDEPGVRRVCDDLGFRHFADVQRSEFGTPLLNDLFRQAETYATNRLLAFTNADIILTPDVISATATVANYFDRFLLIARRWNVDIPFELNFERPDWELELRKHLCRNAVLEAAYGGVDVFIYPRTIWEDLPPFRVGRTRWDSALIYHARKQGIPVIDGTAVLTSIHQNHDYSHIPSGTRGVFKGPEAMVNERLLGGEEFIFTPLNATHVLTRSGLRRNRTFYPPYFLRKVATMPALNPRMRPIVPLVRRLAPAWRALRQVKARCSSFWKSGNSARAIPYPVSISAKPIYPAAIPAGGGVESFDTPEARALNNARMALLDALGLKLRGKRVLDVGCGVGHLANHLVARGCEVLCIDGRHENIERLKNLYPNLQARVFDVETDSFSELGGFDVVFAYGLLYHLEEPFRAIRNLSSVCGDLLLIETMVTDHHLPLCVLAEETASYNQALRRIGSRPTPSFVTLALRSAGFDHVYAPAVTPDHPDFRFSWKDDLSHARDGHLLRCMFVSSRQPLANPSLVPLLRRDSQ